MKKNLIILLKIIVIILILLVIFLLYNIITYINKKGTVEVIADYNVLIDYILKNEQNDENLKTFIAVKNISTKIHKENVDYYVLALIDTYNIEDKSLEHKQSTLKLYKFILEDAKIIDSYNLNIEDIKSYNDYSIFPKDIIEKYSPLKDSLDLTKSIEKQIDNFYNETNDIKENEITEDYRVVGDPVALQ